MQQAIRTKLVIAILAVLSAAGLLLAHQLKVNQQTALSTSRLAAERNKAAQIDQDDWAAVKKIRERNAQRKQ